MAKQESIPAPKYEQLREKTTTKQISPRPCDINKYVREAKKIQDLCCTWEPENPKLPIEGKIPSEGKHNLGKTAITSRDFAGFSL